MYSEQIIIAGPHLNFDTGINFQLKYLINLIKTRTKYNVIYCNIGKAETQNTSQFDFPVYNIKNVDNLISIIDKYNVKRIITSHDLVKLDMILLAKINRCFNWIHYFMSESDNHSLELVTHTEDGISRGSLENIIEHIDVFIPATITSYTALKDLFQQFPSKKNSFYVLDNLPSFIDFSYSFSGTGRKMIRDNMKLTDNDFLFLVVARNQPRKNLPIYFEAIKLVNEKLKGFIKLNPPTAKLFVLSWPISPMGYDLEYLKKYYKLDGLVFLRDLSNYTEEFNKTLLNDIYSAADTLLSCPYAEGLGYPIFEAGLCDTPIILSNCMEAELILNDVNMVTILEKGKDFFFPGVNQKWAYTDVEKLVDAMLDNMQLIDPKKDNFNRNTFISTYIKKYFNQNEIAETQWIHNLIHTYETQLTTTAGIK